MGGAAFQAMFVGGYMMAVLDRAASMINFDAFIAFISVNLSVIFVFFKFLQRRTAGSLIAFVSIPAVGVAIDVWLWFSLDTVSMILGGIWVLAGLMFMLVKTRGFTAPAPDLTGPIDISMYD